MGHERPGAMGRAEMGLTRLTTYIHVGTYTCMYEGIYQPYVGT